MTSFVSRPVHRTENVRENECVNAHLRMKIDRKSMNIQRWKTVRLALHLIASLDIYLSKVDVSQRLSRKILFSLASVRFHFVGKLLYANLSLCVRDVWSDFSCFLDLGLEDDKERSEQLARQRQANRRESRIVDLDLHANDVRWERERGRNSRHWR